MDHPAADGARCHAGEPGHAGSAHEAEQHGLGLVVERVGGGDVGGADVPRAADEEVVAAMARALLQAGRGLGAVPGQQVVRQAEGVGGAGDGFGLGARLRAQPVVDGGDGQRRQGGVGERRGGGEVHQRGAVGAAGHGEEHGAGLPEGREERCGLVEAGAGERVRDRARRGGRPGISNGRA